MKGSNFEGVKVGGGLGYGLISELRTSLLEIVLLTEGVDDRAYETAKQTLKLFDGVLYARDLDHANQIDLLPYSLSAETLDLLHEVDPLCKLHEVEVEYRSTRLRSPVALNKTAYNYAMHGLLFSVLSSLQNFENAKLIVDVSGRRGPSLSVFSESIESYAADLRPAARNPLMTQPVPMGQGIQSGLLLAENLFSKIGKGMHSVNNQYGRGFAMHFSASRQMSLIESLIT